MPHRSTTPILTAHCFILCGLLLLGGCGPATFVVGVAPGGRALTASTVESDGRWFSQRIAIIDVSGMISNAPQAGLLSVGDNPVSALTESLNAAAADPNVAAVILRINTPGGTVTASDMMYREVQRFRDNTGKPVIVLMMDLAASGGYYLACAGDHIIAYPTTLTGSVGVILQTVSFETALQKLGIKADAITSGSNKAAGSPFENLDPAQREIFQNIVDDFFTNFATIVRDARPDMTDDQWETVADGRVFTGTQALQLNLVDQLGDLRDAIELALESADLEHADVIVYHRPLDYVPTPYAKAPIANADGVQINLINLDLHQLLGQLQSGAGVYYLWQPSPID